MSHWDILFNDSTFAPAYWSLPLSHAGPSEVVAAPSPLTFINNVEPVGYTYNTLVAPPTTTYTVVFPAEDAIDVDTLLDNVREARLDDYYGLLNCKEKFLDSTEADFQANFKYINLYLHPDKIEPSKRADAEVRFKAIQRALNTLTDPVLRIDYDSGLDFDDSIPTPTQGVKDTADFIKTFYPVFERNARFSKIKPVPMLGDESSTEEQLNRFYKFWFAFQSWREFPEGDTNKCGDSASRDERRHAAAKNKKSRETLKAKEMLRIKNFVTRASDIDPRMKEFKLKRAEAEKRKKQEAYDAKQRQIAEANQKIADEKAAKVAAELAAKAEAERVRLEAKKLTEVKNKLTGALTREKTFVDKKSDYIQSIVAKLTSTYNDALEIDKYLLLRGYNDLKGINGKEVLDIDLVLDAIDEVEGRPKGSSRAPTNTDSKAWTDQELALLAKGTLKYPVGTKDRWEKVADHINTMHSRENKRTAKQVILKVKEQELERQVGGQQQLDELKKSVQASKAASTTASPSGESSSVDPDLESWTADEQKALESGLMSISKDEEDRWQLISDMVGTRSKAQCVARYKYLREQVAAKKKAAAAASSQ